VKTIVIGGGVVGLSCAYELAARDVAVTVLDAGQVGDGASAGNAGWVTSFLSAPRAAPGAVGDALRGMLRTGGPARVHPHLDVEFLSWVARFLRASRPAAHHRGAAALRALAEGASNGFDELAERGVAFARYRAGLAIVAKTEKSYQVYRRLAKAKAGAGFRSEIRGFRGAEIPAFDPAIRRDVYGVLHIVDDWHVRPETVTRGLARALRTGGSLIRESSTAHRILRRGRHWVVETNDGADYTADSVLVTAGFGTRCLLKRMDINLPLEAARGTSLTAYGDGSVPAHPLKLSEDMVACSPFCTAVRLSGAFDVGSRGIGLDRRRLGAIVERGLSYLHDWRPTHVESRWVGHRPMAPDDLPVIGGVPGRGGLYVATGHGTLGMTLGPVTGRLVALEMTGHATEAVLEPFRPHRFGRNRPPA
jgi:D-amino-acid dehydrogenase